MKYERVAGASGAALSLLLLAGCSGPEDVHNSKAELPAAVQKQIGGHVLQLVYEKPDGKIDRATAVRVAVGKKTIDITAAHAVQKSAEHCADETLIRDTPTNNHFQPIKQSSTAAYEQAVSQSTTDNPTLEGQDIAALVNDSDADQYKGIRTKQTIDIQPGEQMTFVNYQETPSGKSRDIEAGGTYAKPAAFTGTYLGMRGNKLAVATGHGTSYGEIDDYVTRSGASGGAAFAGKDAQFAGITMATSTTMFSANELNDGYGVHLKSGDYRITSVEPVTTDVAQELYQEALAQPDCTNAGQ